MQRTASSVARAGGRCLRGTGVARACAALIAVALCLAGCGSAGRSSSATTVTVTRTAAPAGAAATATATSATSAAARALAAESPCTSVITRAGAHGACAVRTEVPATVVAKGRTGRLAGIAAKLLSARVTKTLTGPGSQESAKGMYVVVSIAVTNELSSEQHFIEDEAGQAYLLVDGKLYGPAVNAENSADANSFLSKHAGAIAPGETLSGDVVFDLPPAVAQAALREGALQLAEFGVELPTPPSALLLQLS